MRVPGDPHSKHDVVLEETSKNSERRALLFDRSAVKLEGAAAANRN